jgi:hypothetical protein
LRVGGGNKALDHANRNGLRLAAIHQQAINAQRTVDASPAIARSVNHDENVAREEGRRDRLDLPRVTSVLPVARNERAEALI